MKFFRVALKGISKNFSFFGGTIIISAFLAIFATSCTKTENSEMEKLKSKMSMIPQKSDDHAWYSFANGSFIQVTLPQNSSIQPLRPWTESTRISDADTGLDGNGYMLVNHIGALLFEKKPNPTIINDRQLLSDSTASHLIFSDGNAYFTLSKNAAFNKTLSEDEVTDSPDRPYLVRIATDSKMFYPCVTYGDLKIGEGEEISGSHFDGESWISSIRYEGRDPFDGKEKVQFRYQKWYSTESYADLSAKTREGKIEMAEVLEDDYRAPKIPQAFSSASVRLRNLLSPIPDSFDYAVTVRVPGGPSPKYYIHGSLSASTNANAVESPNWVCAVFADGTTYFAGALDNRPEINGGNTVAFRLPKLPKNYFYTNFCISGDFMVVGWEENDFFKTGRSGFLTVDMAKLFYIDEFGKTGD